MKKIYLIISFINFIVFAYPQFFKGIIQEVSSNNKLSFVSIYLDGTTVGTNSDVNGYFELDISKNKNLPITISALGYYSVTLNEYSTNKVEIIYLTPKDYQINEVLISAKYKNRNKKNMKLFKNEFIGKTQNASECEILNENEILFSYDPGGDTLRIYSSKPILINNKALGYHLTYYLDKFEYCKSSKEITIRGNCIFKDDLLEMDDSLKEITTEKRKEAYQGSRMHFFRSLWGGDITSSNRYLMRDSNNVKLDYYDLVTVKGRLIEGKDGPEIQYYKYLKSIGKIYIWYLKNKEYSYIDVSKEVFFDKRGYYDPFDIIWYNDMSKQRMADQLPFDFTLN